MLTVRVLLRSAFVAFFVLTAAPAAAQSFFSNFLKPEFLVPVTEFPAASGGDLQLTYYMVPMPVVKNGELLIVGEFPRSRYFSVTAYDDHGAVVGILNDVQIEPYGSSGHPFRPGGAAGAEDVLYAITVRLDAPLAQNPTTQCATPLGVHTNLLDARSRHTASGFYSSQQSGFSAQVSGQGQVTHVDAPVNSGTFLMIRSYLQQPPAASSQFDLRKPLVWVRASSTGCSPQLAATGQALTPAQWFSLNSVLQMNQTYAHVQHEVDLGTTQPFGPDPVAEVSWFGREEYLPGHAVGRYLSAVMPLTPSALNSQGRVMQLQFRLPSMPCRTSVPCTLTGAEALRYWSLTYEDSAGRSLASFSELALTPDANGYVTAIISFGAALPAHVSAANGYSRIALATPAAYRAVLRNYLPSAVYTCSTSNVPPRTAEYHPNGGYMGESAPVITFPLAASLPTMAVPFVQGGSCQWP